MGLSVVPMWIVTTIGPALSSDANTGAVMAEQIMRNDASSDIVIELCQEAKGTKVAGRALSLPPLMPGYSWDNIADELRAKVKAL